MAVQQPQIVTLKHEIDCLKGWMMVAKCFLNRRGFLALLARAGTEFYLSCFYRHPSARPGLMFTMSFWVGRFGAFKPMDGLA